MKGRALTQPACPLPIPAHDQLGDGVDRKRRRIEHLRIRRGNQRCDRAVSVARIPFRQVPGKGAKISRDSFVDQLLISPLGPDFRARCQEQLERRVGKNNSSHVAAVGNQPWRPAKGTLALQQTHPDLGNFRYFGRALAYLLAAHIQRNILIRQEDFSTHEIHGHALGDLRQGLLGAHPVPQRHERDQAVERAAFEVVKRQLIGHAPGDRALAGGRGTIDGDHRRACHAAAMLAKALKYSGKVLATQPGSLMRTGTPPSAASEKLIAMRWSSYVSITAVFNFPGEIRRESLPSSTRAPSLRSSVAIAASRSRSEEHTSELQSRLHLVCRLLLEKKKKK